MSPERRIENIDPKELIPPYTCPGCGSNLMDIGALRIYAPDTFLGHVNLPTENGIALSIDKILDNPLMEIECVNCGKSLDKLAKEVDDLSFDPYCEDVDEEEDD